MWTHFWDMHSGGGQKEPQSHIYIEAGEEEAKVIFEKRFGHDPERVTCSCCGGDYVIRESKTLDLATAYQRGCQWPDGAKEYDVTTGRVSLEDYCKNEDVLVIRAEEVYHAS